VIGAYMGQSGDLTGTRSWDSASAPGSSKVKLVSISLLRESQPVSAVTTADELDLEIRYEVLQPNVRFRCEARLLTQGVCAFSTLEPAETVKDSPGHYASRVRIPKHLLAEGEYFVSVLLPSSHGVAMCHARVREALAFHVTDTEGDVARQGFSGRHFGVVSPRLQWESHRVDGADQRRRLCG
jgi:hypothetical protein